MTLPKEAIKSAAFYQEQAEAFKENADPVDPKALDDLVQYCEFANAKLAELQVAYNDAMIKLAMVAKVIK